jgi:5'(3')-deoxyribonucleotidase
MFRLYKLAVIGPHMNNISRKLRKCFNFFIVGSFDSMNWKGKKFEFVKAAVVLFCFT